MCQFVFATAAQNANVERIFSLINTQWTDERDRLKIETIKDIKMTQYNFREKKFSAFYEYFRIIFFEIDLNKIMNI